MNIKQIISAVIAVFALSCVLNAQSGHINIQDKGNTPVYIIGEVFEGASGGMGGAISVQGSYNVNITDSDFFNNTSTGYIDKNIFDDGEWQSAGAALAICYASVALNVSSGKTMTFSGNYNPETNAYIDIGLLGSATINVNTAINSTLLIESGISSDLGQYYQEYPMSPQEYANTANKRGAGKWVIGGDSKMWGMPTNINVEEGSMEFAEGSTFYADTMSAMKVYAGATLDISKIKAEENAFNIADGALILEAGATLVLNGDSEQPLIHVQKLILPESGEINIELKNFGGLAEGELHKLLDIAVDAQNRMSFSEAANYFSVSGENTENAVAEIYSDGLYLRAISSQIPEAADFAKIIGAAALAALAFRKRKSA